MQNANDEYPNPAGACDLEKMRRRKRGLDIFIVPNFIRFVLAKTAFCNVGYLRGGIKNARHESLNINTLKSDNIIY